MTRSYVKTFRNSIDGNGVDFPRDVSKEAADRPRRLGDRVDGKR